MSKTSIHLNLDLEPNGLMIDYGDISSLVLIMLHWGLSLNGTSPDHNLFESLNINTFPHFLPTICLKNHSL